jgi:sulfur-oxidizing protein SoxX
METEIMRAENALYSAIKRTRTIPVIFSAALLCLAAPGSHADAGDEARLEQGKQLATTRSKGNCLACHAMDDGKLAGNLGPPLLAMKLRFPDKAVLRAQVWDATERNPDSRMPPFGKHGILSEEEIDLIVDYIYSL